MAILSLPSFRQRTPVPSCSSLNALSPSLMDPIVQHPAIPALSKIRPRSRLKEEHKYLFDGTNRTNNDSLCLFDELALVACSTGVVCRKELLETYAAATFIHAKFPHMKRMADLAAGHGLLSWFLLVLDHYDNNNNSTTTRNNKQPPRTIVCVDRRMPQSADVIASAMIDRFPELEPRWCFVQSDLSAVEPHPSCLLISVHACGTLTDYLIEMAIGTTEGRNTLSGGSPLAIVPCCHTVKERMGYRPHRLSGMDAQEVSALVQERKKKQKHLKHEAVADVVDEVRCRTLRNAGYEVEEVMLPEAFTGRNRLLLGEAISVGTGTDKAVGRSNHKDHHFFQRHPNLPFIRIPLADDDESIAQCHAVSGREMKQTEKQLSPSLVMSFWLTDTADVNSSDNNSVPTLEALQALADQCCGEMETEEIQCSVEVLGDVKVQCTTRRRSQFYRFTYKKSKGADLSAAHVSCTTAKRMHTVIRERVGVKFGGLLQ